jgi:hypothetical protein
MVAPDVPDPAGFEVVPNAPADVLVCVPLLDAAEDVAVCRRQE